MSTWNYRMVRRVFKPGTPEEETTFAIHEAFYDNDDHTVVAITENPVPVYSDEGAEGLKEILEMMRDALARPIIEWGSIKQVEPERQG